MIHEKVDGSPHMWVSIWPNLLAASLFFEIMLHRMLCYLDICHECLDTHVPLLGESEGPVLGSRECLFGRLVSKGTLPEHKWSN